MGQRFRFLNKQVFVVSYYSAFVQAACLPGDCVCTRTFGSSDVSVSVEPFLVHSTVLFVWSEHCNFAQCSACNPLLRRACCALLACHVPVELNVLSTPREPCLCFPLADVFPLIGIALCGCAACARPCHGCLEPSALQMPTAARPSVPPSLCRTASLNISQSAFVKTRSKLQCSLHTIRAIVWR